MVRAAILFTIIVLSLSVARADVVSLGTIKCEITLKSQSEKKADDSPELREYKEKMLKAIESMWLSRALPVKDSLEPGTVRIHCTVYADGGVKGKVLEPTGPNQHLLPGLAKDVLNGPVFLPFPEKLQQEMGDQFVDTVTFTIGSTP